MISFSEITVGGGCHWCTEAVSRSLKGVQKVEQGFVASDGENTAFSEAMIVHYDENLIAPKDLISIHLHTHESTSQHSMRNKYRSAVYFFSEEHKSLVTKILRELQADFDRDLITEVLPFKVFKPSDEMFHNYYFFR